MRVLLLVALVALAAAPLPAASAPQAAAVPASAGAAALAAAARSVPLGGKLTVSGWPLQGEAQAATFELQRFDVWRSDAKVVVHRPGAAPEVQRAPTHAYFKGAIAGNPQSAVLLAVHADGRVAGLASANGHWALGRSGGGTGPQPAATAPVGGALSSRKATQEELASLPDWKCGVDGMNDTSLMHTDHAHPTAAQLGAAGLAATASSGGTVSIAIETGEPGCGRH